jgi:2-methylisocitrate lyase-like PEP mutase family enzyme
VVDAVSARLVERAAFESVYVTGGGIARSMGFPDVGLVTMTEVVDRVRLIAQSVSLPVIADADTGYGNAINLMRTIVEFETTGVAAVHIEDQVTPKKCGHYSGKQLVPSAEMEKKIAAAIAARRDPDLVIIARTDGRGVEGFEAAVARANAYVKAGADAIFVEAPETLGEIEELPKRVTAPLLINMFAGGKTPVVSATDLEAMGYRIVIYPSQLQRAAIRATQRALDQLKRDETGEGATADLMVSFEERDALAGLADVKALEERFLVGEDTL